MVSNIGPISAKILKIDLRRLVVESMAIHQKELNATDATSTTDLFDTGDFYEVMFKDPFRSPIDFKVEDEEPPAATQPDVNLTNKNKLSSGRLPPGDIIKKTLKKKYRDESRR